MGKEICNKKRSESKKKNKVTDNEIISLIIEELFRKHDPSGREIKDDVLKSINLTLGKDHSIVIREKILATNFVIEKEEISHDDYCLSISSEGRLMVEKFGSYIKYLETEKKSEDKEKKGKSSEIISRRVMLFCTIAFGISTAILGWKNSMHDSAMQAKDMAILDLSNKLDIKQKTVDSLTRQIITIELNKHLNKIDTASEKKSL